jgi:hypothetical protein
MIKLYVRTKYRSISLCVVLPPGHVGSDFEDIPDLTQVKKVKTLNLIRVWLFRV